MYKSVERIINHLLWTIPSLLILSRLNNYFPYVRDNNGLTDSSDRSKLLKRFGRKERKSFWKSEAQVGSDWMTFANRKVWLWWVILGYSASVLGFHVFDCVRFLIERNYLDFMILNSP